LWLADKPATSVLSFGFHRAEILGALLSVLLIWGITGVLVFEAVHRIHTPEDVDGRLMFCIAALGLAVNFIMGVILHQAGVGHSHGLGGGHGHSHGNSNKNNNEEQTKGHGHSHNHGHGGSGGGSGHSHERLTSEQKGKHGHHFSEHGGSEHDHGHGEHGEHGHGEHGHGEHGHSHGDKSKKYQKIENHDQEENENAPRRRDNSNKMERKSISTDEDHDLEKQKIENCPEKNKKSQGNINVTSAFIHVIGDAVQSIGVMLAAALIWWNPSYRLADPICTFFFSILVLFTTLRLVKQSVSILMEGAPEGIEPVEVEEALNSIQGVREVHDLHIWSLSLGKPSLSAHIFTSDEAQKVLECCQRVLAVRFGIHHTTIQIENRRDQIYCNPHYQQSPMIPSSTSSHFPTTTTETTNFH